MERVHKVIAEIEPHDSVERYTSLGVEVLQGYAKLIDPWTVEIKLNDGGTQRLTTRSIVIAAGARPRVALLDWLDPNWLKALHVISVIAWMAGMMYLPRLFVYHAESALGSDKAETFKIMERRLYRGIITPAMIATSSHSRSAWAMTWVEKITVTPSSASARIISSSLPWLIASRPENGSSSTTSRG